MANINYKNIDERMIAKKMIEILYKENPWTDIIYVGIHEDEDGRFDCQLVGIVEYTDYKEDCAMVKPFAIAIDGFGDIAIFGDKATAIPYNKYDGKYQLWYEVDTEDTIDKENLRKRFAQKLIDDEDGKYDNTTLDEWINDMEEIDMIRRVW